MKNKLFKFIFVVSIASSISYPCLAGESYHASEASNESDSEASYGSSSESSHMPSTMSSQENAAEASHLGDTQAHWNAAAPPGGSGNPGPEVNMNIQDKLGLDAKHVSVANRDGTVVLTGTVRTSAEKARINSVAAEAGVPVVNEIKVEDPDVLNQKIVTIEEPVAPKPKETKPVATSKPAAVSKPPEVKTRTKEPAVH